VLVLTKPLGAGILTTALKGDLLSPAAQDEVYAHMATLNAKAGQAVLQVEQVHACTDVTGFGLLGHAFEMTQEGSVTIRLHGRALPLMRQARELAEMGVIPSGAYRNQDYVRPHLTLLPGAEQVFLDLASDPQTSGGLLVALPPDQAERLLSLLRPFAPWSAIVGQVLPPQKTAMELD